MLGKISACTFNLIALLLFTPALIAQDALLEDISTKEFVVDTEKSYIHIYTGVAGLGKALAHSHLIAIRGISGEIRLTEEAAFASLEFFSERFLVDDDDERARAADESFRAPVSESIKTGTKENMLSQPVLDSEAYPKITLGIRTPISEVTNSIQSSREAALIVDVGFKGEDYSLVLPVKLQISDAGIKATGDFSLDHTDLGLKPFSAAAGLARVAESLRFHFEIHSTPAGEINESPSQ